MYICMYVCMGWLYFDSLRLGPNHWHVAPSGTTRMRENTSKHLLNCKECVLIKGGGEAVCWKRTDREDVPGRVSGGRPGRDDQQITVGNWLRLWTVSQTWNNGKTARSEKSAKHVSNFESELMVTVWVEIFDYEPFWAVQVVLSAISRCFVFLSSLSSLIHPPFDQQKWLILR